MDPYICSQSNPHSRRPSGIIAPQSHPGQYSVKNLHLALVSHIATFVLATDREPAMLLGKGIRVLHAPLQEHAALPLAPRQGHASTPDVHSRRPCIPQNCSHFEPAAIDGSLSRPFRLVLFVGLFVGCLGSPRILLLARPTSRRPTSLCRRLHSGARVWRQGRDWATGVWLVLRRIVWAVSM